MDKEGCSRSNVAHSFIVGTFSTAIRPHNLIYGEDVALADLFLIRELLVLDFLWYFGTAFTLAYVWKDAVFFHARISSGLFPGKPVFDLKRQDNTKNYFDINHASMTQTNDII